MPDKPASPAPPDDDLRETVDLMGKLVARMSDRVDTQTKILKDLDGTVAEARSAAFTAAEQTDPEHYGQLVGETIDGKINDNLVRMGQMCVDLFNASNRAQDALKKAEEDKSVSLRQVWEREQKDKTVEIPFAMVWSRCCRSGFGAVGAASSFLSQQRFSLRCPWGVLEHDNHGC